MNISLEVGTSGVQSQNMLRDYSMIHTLIMSSEGGTIGVYPITKATHESVTRSYLPWSGVAKGTKYMYHRSRNYAVQDFCHCESVIFFW